MIVPENRNDPNSRLIELPVIKIHATTDSIAEPILNFNGSPGISNMIFNPPVYLLQHHDVIMVGYRGNDGSVCLNCPEIKKALKSNRNILEENSLRAIGNAWTACASRLKNEKVGIDGYTIMDVIDDFEAVRKNFGYEQINLISQSYGTRVAYIYMN